MRRVLVTGATGFIGSHVARQLLEAGYEVRALVRPASADEQRRNPLDPRCEVCPGDVRSPPSLRHALQGCDALVHTAADYRLWARAPWTIYDTNLIGTRNLLVAALRQGVQQVVYTSSVAACGIPTDGTPGNETTPIDQRHLAGAYKRSKYLAEHEALSLAREGLPVVVVNPSTPVGPGDVKPTPTGRIIVDFLRGRLPAYLDTGLNLIAVEDCARGHVLALEKGQIGERYILGNRNLSLHEILGMLAKLAHRAPPRFKVPRWLAYAAAYSDELIEGRLLRRAPGIPVNGVRMSAHHMYFDASKAVRELGLPQSPVEDALARAITWFRAEGYV
ncbi:MAG TPA: hopanoid-associated sugar epimerase [Ktedonobacterales bacterium]|nr:hopanoid-associated sugar epimerase [Ktedonobacterales bacterium]